MRALRPDIVLAQECRRPQDSPLERFRHLPCDSLEWRAAGHRGWGTGLFTVSAKLTPIAIPEYHGWVVGGEIQKPIWSPRPVRVFSIHAPVGERGYIRTMQHILDRIALLRESADLVLGGDFNVAVSYRQPRDPVRILRGEIDILDRLSNEFDLVSCWQAANPGRPLAQTLRWMGNPTAPYHCDGIFVPREWLSRLKSCRVVHGSRWRQLSDHNPVVAEFGAVPCVGFSLPPQSPGGTLANKH
jgi:endonuclease/exonuclease/phosphatase family metal-dependent hydrolase